MNKRTLLLLVAAGTVAGVGAGALPGWHGAIHAAAEPPGNALAYAHVQANGTIDHDSGNVTASKIFAGGYCLGVTGGAVHVAVASLDARPNVGGTVQAGVFTPTGCPSTANNILVVTRPQTQNGGMPGADRAFYVIVY